MILNEWEFVPMWFLNGMQLLACVCDKQSSHTLPTRAFAQAPFSKIAQKIQPDVTIFNAQTLTAIAEVESCPLLTTQVVPARTWNLIYPLSHFLSLAVHMLRIRLAHGLLCEWGSHFVTKVSAVNGLRLTHLWKCRYSKVCEKAISSVSFGIV